MAPFTVQLVILACIGATFAQQRFQQAPSVVEPDYDYADAPPQRPQQAALVSRASGPAPSRNSILSDSVVKTTTPVVAILKQINRHNEDGSYTYGYEGGDGSFKIETKLATGEVMGKYGYVDDTGKVRVIEYGANKYGFQPSGEGITVPEPNLVEETTESFDKNGRPINNDSEEPIVERPRPRQPARAPAQRPAPARQQQQFASASFQSRGSFEQDDQQDNRAPVQFLPQEQPQSPPRASQSFSAPPPPPPPQQPSFSGPPPSFSGPSSSFSGPSSSFSAFLTSDDAPPPRLQPARLQPQFNAGPAPPRPASFPGAAPAGPPPSFASAGPAPPRPVAFAGASPVGPSDDFQSQPQFRPRPAQSFFQPAPPSFSQPPRSAFAQPLPARPAPSRQSSSSILDQLAQDFALPQGGSRPLHDITFGAQ